MPPLDVHLRNIIGSILIVAAIVFTLTVKENVTV